MLDFITEELGDVRKVIEVAVVVFALAYVVFTFITTRQLIPTLVALVMAGLVIWGVNNISWFKEGIEKETDKAKFSVLHETWFSVTPSYRSSPGSSARLALPSPGTPGGARLAG